MMEKNDLLNILNETLIPIGFKKKANNWALHGDSLTKIVSLQKSQFSNCFYINYGFVIKSIPLDGNLMHIFNGFGSVDSNENSRIKELLDLENHIPNADRMDGLKKFLVEGLVSKIQAVNSEEDLLNELKERIHLIDISLAVKKYFKLD